MLLLMIATTLSTYAQWQQAGNVASNTQNVYALATDGTHIFAGTGAAGVSMSTNNGDTWTLVNNGMTSTGIGSLAISGSTVYAGDSGVYVTTNNGALWTPVRNGLPLNSVNAILVNGTSVYVGTQTDGVYRSTNNGTLWTAANKGFTGQVVTLAVMDTTLFLGAPNNGVYLSTNQGGLWTKKVNGLSDIDVHSLAVSGTTLFAGTSGGVFKSTNKGSNWTAMNNGLTNLFVNSILIHGIDIFAGTNDGVFHSDNEGASWTGVNEGLISNAGVWTLAINGTTLFAGMRLDPYGVWRRPLTEMTGVKELKSKTRISVYPNPCSEKLMIGFDKNMDQEVELTLVNSCAEQVITRTFSRITGSVALDIAGLPDGIYALQIRCGTQLFSTQKVMILR